MSIPWGPTGTFVYNNRYSRTQPDGTKEDLPATVKRVVYGNNDLVPLKYIQAGESTRLVHNMMRFADMPAGRHWWASGVKGRQFLMNCWVSHWTDRPSEHFEFSFLRLMEGGGVGANYSQKYLTAYPNVVGPHEVHIVCDPDHPDYAKMRDAGLLSERYVSDWGGAFEVEDSREGWAEALVDLIDTYYRDATYVERVFDVSRVRGEGERLKSFGGTASGPAPLAVMLHEVSGVLNECGGGQLDGMAAMEIDHAIGKCVVSGGTRRSARMSMMRWDDPQIHYFLNCKGVSGKHWTTNISVEIDDDFISLLDQGDSHAMKVWNQITTGMLTNGEPGVWNSSLSNVGEPDEVVCTNPCGEIALRPWEPCNLGHVNLAAFVDIDGEVDMKGLKEAHRLMTRFLIRATYGDVTDEKSRDVLDRNRRIGVGHLGFASHVAMRGIRYSDAPNDPDVVDMLVTLKETVEDEARRYAHELRIPVPVKVTTVAPTGTIAKMPGVSEGVHPIFAKYFIRRIRLSTIDPDQVAELQRYEDDGYQVEHAVNEPNTAVVAIPTKDSLVAEVEKRFGSGVADRVVQSAGELSVRDMLNVQELYQSVWADNAVSYTVNVDPDRYTADDLKYVLADYLPVLKGMTVFPEMSHVQPPYERIDKDWYESRMVKDVSDGVDEECASGACPIF